MSFKQYFVLKEENDSSSDSTTNKDWRKGFIQLEKGFIPPKSMRPIIEAFAESGKHPIMKDTTKDVAMPQKSLFLAPNATRDFLKGKSPKKLDLVTNALPEQIAHILHNAGFKVQDMDMSNKKGKELELRFKPEKAQPGDNKLWFVSSRDDSPDAKAYGITAVVDGDQYRISPFRKDPKISTGSVVANFVDNPVDDAISRDLTINALYIELSKVDGENTKLYDPTKQGWHDVMNGQVRAIGKASDRFGEDKIRILRAIRFHCRFGKGAKMHKDIEEALPKFSHLSGVPSKLIREEFLKGLIHPDVDPKLFLSLYKKYGLLDKVFPSLKVNTEVPSQFRDRQDKILSLAWLLQDNPTDEIKKVLSSTRRDGGEEQETGWSNQESTAVIYLLKLKEFDPENIDELLEEKPKAGITDDQIRNWVDFFNITDAKGRVRNARPQWAKRVRAFAEFKPDDRENITWNQTQPCSNCKGAGCDMCDKGRVESGIHPEITSRGLQIVAPHQRDQVVRMLNKQRLKDAFEKKIAPTEMAL
jgi:tRNA nucleotidyltransferase/poly(A) polymerase